MNELIRVLVWEAATALADELRERLNERRRDAQEALNVKRREQEAGRARKASGG